jgi:HEAT repeat protein
MSEALDDSDQGVRHIALSSISRLSKKKLRSVIPALAPRLAAEHEPDPQIRAQIARLIARQETAARAALPDLNEAVKNDPDFNVRSACLFAIYNVSQTAEEALPAPTHVLAHDRDPRLRHIAAERLGKYGAASAPAVPQLIAALADSGVPARAADDPLRGKDEPVCMAAVAALTQIGEPAVAALVSEISSENRVVRVLAIRTLGDIGPAAKAAVPALERAAASNDATESAAAKTALAKIRAEK